MKKVLFAILTLFPVYVFAHGVGEVYSLPIPLNYYLYTSGVVVFLSFVVTSLLTSNLQKLKQKEFFSSTRMQRISGIISFLLLVLTILTGILGTENISKNFATLFFWIYFLIGMNIASFVFGNIWLVINPWKFLCENILKLNKGELQTPGYIPILFVFLFYWFELVSGYSFIPSAVSYLLLTYTLINIIGYKMFSDWFKSGELFSVIFGFISKISITKIINFSNRSTSVSLKPFYFFIFVCVLLAGISYDSIKETLLWFSITDYFGLEFESKITQTIGLVITIIPFLTLFLASIFCIKYFTKIKDSVTELIEKYLPSLSPIVFGYFLAHNFSIFIVSIPIFIPTLLDPFGFGWNLFNINSLRFAPLILGAKFIWYVEIFFIVAGHILAVIYAHLISKNIFETKKDTFKADLFLLPLMIAYTVITLWLISLPLVSI